MKALLLILNIIASWVTQLWTPDVQSGNYWGVDEEKIIVDTEKFIKNFDIENKTVNLSELGLNNDISEKLKNLLTKYWY